MIVLSRTHEIELMRKSSRINVESASLCSKKFPTYKNEFQIAAKIEFEFRNRGAAGTAYNSICAAGANATILHYNENRCALKKDDLVLIDAGCEYAMYASDITHAPIL